MREIGRVKQGFFPTQDRIVQMIAGLFCFAGDVFSVVDAGCGIGTAIKDLRDAWLKQYPQLQVSLLGVESDKGRYTQAKEVLNSVLWSSIEDTYVEGPASLLWFNPPFDKIRGAGRLELSLFNKVKDWPARAIGHMLLIVPDYVLSDEDCGLAVAIERDYEVLGLWHYPEPEYSDFKQCVLLAKRRAKALDKTRLLFPSWASNPDGWPILPDNIKPVAELKSVCRQVTLRRVRLSDEILVDTVSRSPLRGAMLREATASAPAVGRPLLPLKHGHLALALAGGLCDGIIKADDKRFLIKGSLASAIRKTATKDSLDGKGEKIAEIDIYRTRYEMNVRCLLENGAIENYTSADPAEVESEEEEEA